MIAARSRRRDDTEIDKVLLLMAVLVIYRLEPRIRKWASLESRTAETPPGCDGGKRAATSSWDPSHAGRHW